MSLKFKENGAFEVEDYAEELPIFFILNNSNKYKIDDLFMVYVKVGEK
jgi:hypothetical protein